MSNSTGRINITNLMQSMPDGIDLTEYFVWVFNEQRSIRPSIVPLVDFWYTYLAESLEFCGCIFRDTVATYNDDIGSIAVTEYLHLTENGLCSKMVKEKNIYYLEFPIEWDDD